VIAAGVEVAVADVERVLGADDEVIPVGRQQVAEDRLGGAVGVLVGRVDEGAAGLGEQLELLGALPAGAPQPQSVPKVMVPRATSLTRRPELPSNV
jgi:hypothetical protein